MKGKTILIALLAATILGLIVVKLAKNKEKINKETSYHEITENVPVNVLTAASSSLNPELRFVGIFNAGKEASVSAEISGRITRIFVNEGDYISEGQTIAELDRTSLDLKLEADQAQYLHSKEDLVRYENLNKQEATTDVLLKQMRLTNSLNEIAVKNTKEQISKCKIKAPISGYLTTKNFEIGTMVPANTSIGHVTNTGTLKFTTMVPEQQMVKLELRQRVTIRADVFKDTNYTGVISQISEKGDENHNYKIEVTVTNSNTQFPLKAGMSGTMTVNDKRTLKGIFISREILQGTMSKPQVYVAENNKATLRKVKIGTILGNTIQILDGIHDGDKIITTGMNSLKDNTTIKIVATTTNN